MFRAAVIGAGMIGCRMDIPGTEFPMSHAGAYRAAGHDLVAFVDPAADTEGLATSWGCRAYADIDAMWAAERPDLVSFSCPTEDRADLMMMALTHKPRLAIAEKPLAATLRESVRVADAYARAGIPILVNYSRRFTPFWQGQTGRSAMTATIRYAKGLRHNGTHALDLCHMLWGKCTSVRALYIRSDHWAHDPTVSAHLSFEGCAEVFLQALDERCFTLFEVDVVGADYRFIVDQDGRRVREFRVQDRAGIPPGRRLVEVGIKETGAERAMLSLMQSVSRVLDGARAPCGAADAIAAQELAERIVPTAGRVP